MWAYVHLLDKDQELYQLLVENSLGLMCIHDLAGVLLAVNPAVPESLGFDPGAGPGMNLRDFLSPSVRYLFDGYLRRIQQNGNDSGLMRLQAKDGSERVWMYRNTLYQDPGSPAVVIGHALDITERVQAEQALKEAQAALRDANQDLAQRVEEGTAELRAANARLEAEIEQRKKAEDKLLRSRKLESLGVLAGGIAHDFNNFLTVVQGNLELARMRLEGEHPVQRILEETVGACQGAAFLASQLLTFATGGAPVRQVLSMRDIIADAVSRVAAGSRVRFAVDVAEDLRDAEVDAGQIGQALHNVLLNSQQAMGDAGVIELRAENVTLEDSSTARPGAFVRIRIRDSGCGIPAEMLPRIFDPYFTTKPTHAGLGLATAYAVVTKHGGTISVEPVVGGGTMVTIDLPALQAGPLPTVNMEAPRPPAARVLVMDDEPALLTLLERVFTEFGYRVQCARNGAEAIELFQAAKMAGSGFAAVLLDLTVRGGMGGVETAARLREMDPHAKLIVSSGYSDAAVMSDFRSYGFDAVIPKPWKPAELAAVMRRMLAPDRLR